MRWQVVVSVVFLAGLGGCGANIYEERMLNTQVLYARLGLRNQNLAAQPWSDGGGITLRLPKKFAEIPGPAKKDPAAEGAAEPPVEEPMVDLRQPQMINCILPGMRGAFKYGDDQSYLFVLSSKNVKAPEGMAMSVVEEPGHDPLKFNADVCAILSSAMMLEIDYTKFADQNFPRAVTAFVPTVTLKTQLIPYVESRDDGSSRRWLVNLYCYEGNDKAVQACFITIEPETGAESFTNALELGFETLGIDENAFKAAENDLGGQNAQSGTAL